MCVPQQPGLILIVDAETLTEPDAHTLEVLARLQLTARRFGASIRLRNACPRLRDLLGWSGFDEWLPLDAASGVDRDRLAEERKELLVDEVVDPRDPAA
jgi:hypothetical protein